MQFMLILKATPETEAGVMPSEKVIAEMGAFNEGMAKAGVLLAADGLHPSAKGARVRFADGRTTVTDGPFAEPKELVAGYWLIQVRSKEEAIEWVRRFPAPTDGGTGEIEIRQVIGPEDFGPGPG
jgi:hypothetical protein